MQYRISPAFLTLRYAFAPKAPLTRRSPRQSTSCARIPQHRQLHISGFRGSDQGPSRDVRDSGQRVLDKERDGADHSLTQEKERQKAAPWHREGSNLPPVARPRSAGAMTKGTMIFIYSKYDLAYKTSGKLLTTPSRLLKLIIPLTTMDKNTDRKDVEPLALLGRSSALSLSTLYSMPS